MAVEAGEAEGRRRRAILLIPGARQEERFYRRDVLVNNLVAAETVPLARGERIEVAGETGQRLVAQPVRGGGPEPGPDIDLFEAYWADMVPPDAEAGPWRKLGHGLDLLAYWLLSRRTWRAFSVSRYITAGLMFSGLILVLWYVALVLLVADTLQNDDGTRELAAIPVVGVLLGWFFWAAEQVARWYWWALIALVLSLVRVDAMVQLAHFVKDYLENRPDETEVGLRDRLRQRVRATLESVLREPYDEVVVVAHSFATVIILDLLADWPHRDDFRRLRLVTLGSPIAVLRCRSPWLDGELGQILAKPDLEVWFDFHARTDWSSPHRCSSSICTAWVPRCSCSGPARYRSLRIYSRRARRAGSSSSARASRSATGSSIATSARSRPARSRSRSAPRAPTISGQSGARRSPFRPRPSRPAAR